MSAAAVTALIALIALADGRIRDRVNGLNSRAVSHQVAASTTQFDSARLTIQEHLTANPPLTLLVIAGAVLFLCMLRT